MGKSMIGANCPLCNDAAKWITRNLRFDKNANVYHCTACALSFIDQKSFEFPKDFYESEYHQTYLTHIDPAYLDCEKYYQKMLKTTEPWMRKIIPSLTGNETILDFGCSTGHAMSQLKPHCKKISGFELNKKEISFAQSTLGLDVSSVSLHQKFKHGTFDVIMMIFVLEHIADPISLLTYLKPFLKRNGRLIVLVPNIKDPLLSFYDLPDFRNFYYCIEHLFYYSPRSLDLVTSKSGFDGKAVSVQEYPVTNHLSWVYTKKPAEILASRSNVPPVDLLADDQSQMWSEFWQQVNSRYQEKIISAGYGDRVWLEAIPRSDHGN